MKLMAVPTPYIVAAVLNLFKNTEFGEPLGNKEKVFVIACPDNL